MRSRAQRRVWAVSGFGFQGARYDLVRLKGAVYAVFHAHHGSFYFRGINESVKSGLRLLVKEMFRAMDSHSVSRAYAAFAPVYDFIFGPVLEPGRRAAIRSLDLQPGDCVLEVGVGTGLSLPAYPREARVTGIDISPDMLERARARVRRRGLDHVEQLLLMDAGDLQFEDHAFDVVMAMYVISVVEDPDLAVREMRRVCKPGGRIVIVNHFRADSGLVRLVEAILKPLHCTVRIRDNLDLSELIRRTELQIERAYRANVIGYSTVLCCRNGSGALHAI